MDGVEEDTLKKIKHLPLEESISGIAVKEKKIVKSWEIEKEKNFNPEILKLFLNKKFKNIISIPLLYKEDVIGSINMFYKEKPEYTDSDYKVLSGISSAIAMALKNAIYISKIKEEMEMRKKAESKIKEDAEKLEEIVKDRTSELEEKNKKLKHFNDLFVNREFRIKELRDEVAALKAKLADKVIK
jgi:transcriptional regulator with GAF, ATPase, and Fis domain